MKKKHLRIIIPFAIIVFLICLIFVGNILLTNLAEKMNANCKGERFSSVEKAIAAMEAEAREENDTSLDYCPPYQLIHSFEYDNNTIVLYSYSNSFDSSKVTDSYVIKILKHNNDSTLSFTGGFADFKLQEPVGNEDYYYFTNIKTSDGKKSISFLYLSTDSKKEIYVDGIKTEKELVKTADNEFYICYAISKRDTLLSNLFTSISDRHDIEIYPAD